MNLKLKNPQKEDWDLILELRNEFFSQFYKQTKPIEKTEHYKYLEKQESNSKFHHWIIKYENNRVGYVRVLDNDIGIVIKKEFQNKGIASEALRLAEKEAHQLGITKLVALVKVGNESSKNIFTKNNYELKMYWYEKKIL